MNSERRGGVSWDRKFFNWVLEDLNRQEGITDMEHR